MSAANTVTLIMVALVIGVLAGSLYQTLTGHYRHMAAMTARYQAEKNWLDARVAEMMADMERDTTAMKREFKRKTMEVKHGKKRNP